MLACKEDHERSKLVLVQAVLVQSVHTWVAIALGLEAACDAQK